MAAYAYELINQCVWCEWCDNLLLAWTHFIEPDKSLIANDVEKGILFECSTMWKKITVMTTITQNRYRSCDCMPLYDLLFIPVNEESSSMINVIDMWVYLVAINRSSVYIYSPYTVHLKIVFSPKENVDCLWNSQLSAKIVSMSYWLHCNQLKLRLKKPNAIVIWHAVYRTDFSNIRSNSCSFVYLFRLFCIVSINTSYLNRRT